MSTEAFRYIAATMAVVPGTTRIGWIGTGVMGHSMCGHIVKAGYSVTVYNRSPSKALGLCEQGARMAGSVEEVARSSDVVFTIVGYPSDVREVILGGVLEALSPGGIVVDMTTSEPSLAQEISRAALSKGCSALDAPVSGGDKGARDASLAIMVGGARDTFDLVLPLLSLLGNPLHLGDAGCGQSCKMANQVTIASTMVGVVEGMLYAHKAGLDVEMYLRAISGGAAGSRSLDLYSSRIQKRDFEPGFYVHHFVKDLGIALGECQRMGLRLPGLALGQELYSMLQAQGHGHLGTQALVLALESLNQAQGD